jgi:hypothetical protein
MISCDSNSDLDQSCTTWTHIFVPHLFPRLSFHRNFSCARPAVRRTWFKAAVRTSVCSGISSIQRRRSCATAREIAQADAPVSRRAFFVRTVVEPVRASRDKLKKLSLVPSPSFLALQLVQRLVQAKKNTRSCFSICLPRSQHCKYSENRPPRARSELRH